MRLPRKSAFAFLFALCFLASAFCVDGAVAAAPAAEDMARWVRQLGDNSYVTREKASQLLWSAGAAAEPALRDALRSDDPEVVRRAHDILDRFSYGLYPDTPEPIVKLIEQYRSGDQAGRQSAMQELFKAGRPGYAALLKLAGREENPEVRRNLSEQIGHEASQTADVMLADGQMDEAEDLLEMTLADHQDSSIRNFAAFLVLHGTLDAKINQYKPRAEQQGDKQAAEVLAYLYRAGGDLALARQAAERSGKPALVKGVLTEQEDWQALAKAIAKKPDASDGQGDYATLGLKATCNRLAGNTAEVEAELQALAGQDGWSAALVYLFNDRPDEALAMLAKSKNYANAFEFLTDQMKFRQALELADKAKAEVTLTDDVFPLEILKARTLVFLGEKDKGKELFAALADGIKDAKETSHYGSLLEAEYQMELKDQAFDHCAALLGNSATKDNATYLLSQVFPDHKDTVDTWWRYFHGKFPGELPAATLKRLRDLLGAKTAGKDFPDLIHEAEQAGKDLSAPEHEAWLLALATTCRDFGSDDLAESCLEKAAELSFPSATDPWSRPAWLRLADFLAEKDRWKEAAAWYNQAWENDRKQPVPLYLRGWSLTKLGRDKEGQALIERAHWLPLGNDLARFQLAEALDKHALTEAADREWDFILRTGGFQSVAVTNVQNRVEAQAIAHKDFLRAAGCCDRVMLAVLQTGAAFIKTRSYLFVPFSAHRHRARAFLAAGRIKEARKEIQLCLADLPSDTDLPILLLPELEKAGQNKDADDLFSRVFDLHVKLCIEYPRCGWGHNALAWVAARCRRQLDQALEHAEKAVELSPDNAGFLDTLAEVHFQRGEKNQAIPLMKKCIELEPRTEYFQKQLQRFEAGDPRVEVPEER